MNFELSLTRKIALGFTIALGISAALGLFAYLTTREFVESAKTVSRTYKNLSHLNGIQASTVSAESEARGYLLTGKEEFLRRYDVALRDVREEFEVIRNSTKDPVSLGKLNELAELTGARLDRLRNTIHQFEESGLDAVRANSGPGKQLMDDVRRVADGIEARQRGLLEERQQWASVVTRRMLWVVIGAAVLSVFVAGASVVILTADVAHRERMEREILDIGERERRRIGQDLHDGICQQLTGISLLTRGMQQRLDGVAAAEAGKVTSLINDCIEQTRRITRGLHPVSDEPLGLQQALEDLAIGVGRVSDVTCTLDCPAPVPIPDQNVATNMFRIAQEAVQNALRHGRPTQIMIALEACEDEIQLRVRDDGFGFSVDRKGDGLGFEIMTYRANSLGAALRIEPAQPRGTTVACAVPRAAFV